MCDSCGACNCRLQGMFNNYGGDCSPCGGNTKCNSCFGKNCPEGDCEDTFSCANGCCDNGGCGGTQECGAAPEDDGCSGGNCSGGGCSGGAGGIFGIFQKLFQALLGGSMG